MHRPCSEKLARETETAGQSSAGLFKKGRNDMMMEDILYELREVEAGHRRLERPLAKEAADALVMMVDRVRYLEEKVAQAEQ